MSSKTVPRCEIILTSIPANTDSNGPYFSKCCSFVSWGDRGPWGTSEICSPLRRDARHFDIEALIGLDETLDELQLGSGSVEVQLWHSGKCGVYACEADVAEE